MSTLHLDLYHEVQNIYESIKYLEERLKIIREEKCYHPITHIRNYQWRVGAIIEARMCDICGKVLPLDYKITKT